MSAREKLKELRKMADESTRFLGERNKLAVKAGELYYRRAKLARDILRDSHWIGTEFDGDSEKAQAALQDDYFGDLAGSVTLAELLEIVGEFETVEQWRNCGFDLSLLLAQVKIAKSERKRAEKTGEPSIRRTATVAQLDEKESEIATLRAVQKREQSRIADLEKENRELRDENRKLVRDLAVAEGRISELERLVRRDMATA